jgi:hypothetical protein
MRANAARQESADTYAPVYGYEALPCVLKRWVLSIEEMPRILTAPKL